MSVANTATAPEAQKPTSPTTHTFDFCDNSELKGVKKVVVRGSMRGLSPFQRAKLLSSESRVCIAYREGKQLMVLRENVNSAVLYHYCPQLRGFYSCLKETGPTVLLPDTGDFGLVSAGGVAWAVGSFVHEVGEGTRSFFRAYTPSHSGPRQLFHAAATFRAFGLPRSAEHLVAHDSGVIARSLERTAWGIKTPRAVGKWIGSLEDDPLICEADQALLVEARKVFAKRTEGYSRGKVVSR